MEPTTRYVRTDDGVNIATLRLDGGGTGTPLIVAPPYAYNVASVDWTVPDFRAGLERLARSRPVVSYDGRGFGLSDRNMADFGLEARISDLAAVVDSCGSNVNILSRASACLWVIPYAARNPERVRRMILSGAMARGRDYRLNRDRVALSALIDSNFELYLQTVALADFGWDDGKLFAKDIDRYVSRDALVASWQAQRDFDVTEILPQVRCPVLIVHMRWEGNDDGARAPASRALAAALPDATFAEVDFAAPVLFHRGVEEHLRVFEPFFAAGDASAQSAAPALPEGTAVLLFTDIVDSTAITERLGDAAFRTQASALDDRLRAIIREHAGTPVEGKVLGDGVMAVFTAASKAIDAAIACDAASLATDLRLHLGIHAGDVSREGNNVYGGAVNIAARIAGESASGEILVSDTVRSLARTSASVTFEDRGERTLKGIADPQRIFAVRAS